MFYYEEDYSKYFDRFIKHPRIKDVVIFKCKFFYLHEYECILNTYLWSHKVSRIKYKMKAENITTFIQQSGIPKFTHVDIIIRPPYDIFDFLV